MPPVLFFCFTGCIWCCLVSSNSLVVATQFKWNHYTEFDDVLPVGLNITSAAPVRSLIACATYCSGKQWCNSFFYNRVSRHCLRQRMLHTAPGNLTSAEGWRYFQFITEGWNRFYDRLSESSYRLNQTVVDDWSKARQRCQNLGEDLAVLEPLVKAQFVQDYFLANTGQTVEMDIYIGAKRPNASVDFPPSGPDFMWVNGQFVNMTATASFWKKWPTFQSNKAAVEMNVKGDFGWLKATQSFGSRFFLCEKPLPAV